MKFSWGRVFDFQITLWQNLNFFVKYLPLLSPQADSPVTCPPAPSYGGPKKDPTANFDTLYDERCT